jgi:hypothetical protein
VSETSYPLQAVTSNDPVAGWLGGHPRGILGVEWPHCAICGAAMCHLGQFNHSEHFSLGIYRRASLFICHATGGNCEDWRHDNGANALILSRFVDHELDDGPETVKVYHRIELTTSAPVDESVLRVEGGLKGVRATALRAHIDGSKLGGFPIWRTPRAAPEGKNGPMRFLGQLGTEILPFDITAGGMLFLFMDDDEGLGAVLWQKQ